MMGVGEEIGKAVLAMGRGTDGASQHVGHEVHAIADSEHWHAELEDRRIGRDGAILEDAGRST